MRYFKADPSLYEEARRSLNAAWCIPSVGTETSLPQAQTCVSDRLGQVYFGVDDWMCNLSPAGEMLANATASGAISEIDEPAYIAAAKAWKPNP